MLTDRAPISPQQFSSDRYVVLRFYVAGRYQNTTPFDYTVSFEGRILQSGSGATKFDNVYVKEPIQANSPYRFVLHVNPRTTVLEEATVDANTHQIQIVRCGVLRCPDGHEWSDSRFKFCPYDGKVLVPPK